MRSKPASHDLTALGYVVLISCAAAGLPKSGLGLAYGLYTAAAALSFVLVAKFIRETRGRELEDM